MLIQNRRHIEQFRKTLPDDSLNFSKHDQIGFVAIVKTKTGKYTVPLRFDYPFHSEAITLMIDEHPDQLRPEDLLTDATPTLDVSELLRKHKKTNPPKIERGS